MRVIDYAKHLNQRQWKELSWLMGLPIAIVALSDVEKARRKAELALRPLDRGCEAYRVYRELLRALGGHEWHG